MTDRTDRELLLEAYSLILGEIGDVPAWARANPSADDARLQGWVWLMDAERALGIDPARPEFERIVGGPR